jgi:uncharacterized protein
MKSVEIDSLHKAVMQCNVSQVRQALVAGAQVDSLDREGRTSLFYAVQDGSDDIVDELIKSGANVNASDKSNKTPLHFAVSSYQVGIAKTLLRCGAIVDAQDAYGNTPLLDAVFESKGRGQIIGLLLSSGANRTLKNKHGVSPEGLAKSIGNYDLMPFLEQKPA